jgi:glycosyltransferase involved in cell wall biosynthesis
MRIIHFARDYTTHDHRFLAKMVETGHEIFFLRLEDGGQPLEDRPVPAGVTLIPWAGGAAPVTWRDAPRLVADLKRVIRALQPDLIQAGPVQRCAFLTALAGFRNLVSMSWGYDLLMDVNNGKAWQWATRYTLRRSAAFVGDCETIRGIAQTCGMRPDKIVTFPWGADIQKFSPISNLQSPITNYQSPLRLRKGWNADCFVLLSTRGWTEMYGVTDLVTAFVRLAPEFPELRLFMLGGGPLAGRIHAAIQRAGLIDRVHFPGQINQRDLPDYYRAADLYISTSHSDGTSISLLEALASGTPVLLSDIPGNREWVGQDSPAGWLFPAGDARGLEQAIRHALTQRDQLPRMGASARRLAEERGDWDKNFPHLLEAWQMASSQD